MTRSTLHWTTKKLNKYLFFSHDVSCCLFVADKEDEVALVTRVLDDGVDFLPDDNKSKIKHFN